jgi:hypothetical protein
LTQTSNSPDASAYLRGLAIDIDAVLIGIAQASAGWVILETRDTN